MCASGRLPNADVTAQTYSAQHIIHSNYIKKQTNKKLGALPAPFNALISDRVPQFTWSLFSISACCHETAAGGQEASLRRGLPYLQLRKRV